jgi:hypothetical protein
MTTITCTKCGNVSPNLKALLEHYDDYHPEVLKWLTVKHIPSKSIVTMKVPDADTIIKAQNWRKKDCNEVNICPHH